MRKRIALITINPENEHQRDTMYGIFAQCEKADYDVCVFTPMVQISNHFKNYLDGELNIYELINFDMFDGVLITPVPMNEDRITTLTDSLREKLTNECKVPVVSLEDTIGDYPVVKTDNIAPFEEITEHVIKVHKAGKITILAGNEGYAISEERIKGCMNAIRRNGIDKESVYIRYGNFWYNSGEELGEDIANGVVEKPDAVIALSDHMAIGLVQRLAEHGIRVPEDIIVTGYNACKEAILSTPPITSYKNSECLTGAAAVNKLRQMMEPDAPEISVTVESRCHICIGGTCGCKEDRAYTRGRLSEFLFLNEQNYNENGGLKGVDIGMLLESYTSEILTNTGNVEECIDKIYESLYLIKPYEWFYLCLSDEWLNSEKDMIKGYPEKMNKVIISDMAKSTHGYINHVFVGPERKIVFDSEKMLPELETDFGKPQVFFFMPIHFNERTLGYAVLQNDLSQKVLPGLMFKNYLRYLNNALEMTRTRNRITDMSEHDLLTGLYNRRGMKNALEKLGNWKNNTNRWISFVVDMDGLKKINDSLGHSYGDKGIITVAKAVRSITKVGEICVRAGGDEFFIFGLGEYTDEDVRARNAEFDKALAAVNKAEGNELIFSASIGGHLAESTESDPMKAEGIADVKMYISKNSKKVGRE